MRGATGLGRGRAAWSEVKGAEWNIRKEDECYEKQKRRDRKHVNHHPSRHQRTNERTYLQGAPTACCHPCYLGFFGAWRESRRDR